MEAGLVDDVLIPQPKQSYNYRDGVDEPGLAEGGHRGFWEPSPSHHIQNQWKNILLRLASWHKEDSAQ